MVHIGSREFYSDVAVELAASDHILAEDIQNTKESPAKMRRRVTLRALFWVTAWRLELVRQKETLDMVPFKSKVINADVFATDFNDKWIEIQLSDRIWLWAFFATAIAYFGFTLTRKTLAKALAKDDLPSRDDLINERMRGMAEQDAVIVDWRDDHLIQVLSQHLNKVGSRTADTCVLYGAGHFLAIANYLQNEAGFSIGKGKWLTVFHL